MDSKTTGRPGERPAVLRAPPSLAPHLLLLLLLGGGTAVQAACPAVCRCQAGSGGSYEVRCSGRTVEAVPGNLPTETTALWLSETGMTAVPTNAFTSLGALRSLHITDNAKLTDINIAAFSGLEALGELHITGNQVKFVQPGTFVGLTNLKLLDLSGNVWSVAIATMFSGTPVLTTLNLSNNNITDLGTSPFSAVLSTLITLDLSNNNLSSINDQIFSAWDSLLELNLAGNLLAEAPVGHLQTAKNLRTLDVSRNPMKTLPMTGFSKIAKLETLKVNTMEKLDTLTADAFSGLYNLKRLEFVNNRRVAAFTLSHLPAHNQALEEIDLSNNTFTTLERGLFMGRSNLTRLTLENLPLRCDCALSWIGEAAGNTSRWPWAAAWSPRGNASNATNALEEAGPTCATPVNLEGTKAGDLVQEDFTCERAMFYNVSTVNETMANLTGTVTLQASMYPGLPSSLWLHPGGWFLKGSRDENTTLGNNLTSTETVDVETRRVVATLTVESVSSEDLGVYTLVATNAAGNSSTTFTVQLDDTRTGPINSSSLLRSTPVMMLTAFIICIATMFPTRV